MSYRDQDFHVGLPARRELVEVENTVHHFYREVLPVYLVADGCHFLTFSYRQLSYMLAFIFYKC